MAEKTLSVFIDESGDFGPYDFHAPYYLVAMILHNQDIHFARKLNFKYVCTKIRKNECPDMITMTSKLSRSIADVIRKNQKFWEQFEHIIIYYDNGQIELTKILVSVFHALYAHVEFRKVRPVDYKLFQVADLVCTIELLTEKADANLFTRSEREFFCSPRDFKKNYSKQLLKKHL